MNFVQDLTPSSMASAVLVNKIRRHTNKQLLKVNGSKPFTLTECIYMSDYTDRLAQL